MQSTLSTLLNIHFTIYFQGKIDPNANQTAPLYNSSTLICVKPHPSVSNGLNITSFDTPAISDVDSTYFQQVLILFITLYTSKIL